MRSSTRRRFAKKKSIIIYRRKQTNDVSCDVFVGCTKRKTHKKTETFAGVVTQALLFITELKKNVIKNFNFYKRNGNVFLAYTHNKSA